MGHLTRSAVICSVRARKISKHYVFIFCTVCLRLVIQFCRKVTIRLEKRYALPKVWYSLLYAHFPINLQPWPFIDNWNQLAPNLIEVRSEVFWLWELWLFVGWLEQSWSCLIVYSKGTWLGHCLNTLSACGDIRAVSNPLHISKSDFLPIHYFSGKEIKKSSR
jgi:hypothetical protein